MTGETERETVQGTVKWIGPYGEGDAANESYGIVCIVGRANCIGDRICMNLATRRGGQTLVW